MVQLTLVVICLWDSLPSEEVEQVGLGTVSPIVTGKTTLAVLPGALFSAHCQRLTRLAGTVPFTLSAGIY